MGTVKRSVRVVARDVIAGVRPAAVLGRAAAVQTCGAGPGRQRLGA